MKLLFDIDVEEFCNACIVNTFQKYLIVYSNC